MVAWWATLRLGDKSVAALDVFGAAALPLVACGSARPRHGRRGGCGDAGPARYAGARVAGQVAVVVALVSGLAGLAGGLEAAQQGFEVAVQVAMLRTPALLVALMPVLVATGAALAAARRLGRGEEVGLQACGAGPRQAAPGALIVGLGVGLLTFGIHGGVVPWTEARADRLVGAEGAPWVWVEDGAVRVADGLEVTVRGGEVLGVGPTTLDPAVMDARLEAQRPWRARLSLLWAEGSDTSRRELSTRLGRVGACGCSPSWAGSPGAASPGAGGRGRALWAPVAGRRRGRAVVERRRCRARIPRRAAGPRPDRRDLGVRLAPTQRTRIQCPL